MKEATNRDGAAESEGPGRQGRPGQAYGAVERESPSCGGRESLRFCNCLVRGDALPGPGSPLSWVGFPVSAA